jgi:hypothetical protein
MSRDSIGSRAGAMSTWTTKRNSSFRAKTKQRRKISWLLELMFQVSIVLGEKIMWAWRLIATVGEQALFSSLVWSFSMKVKRDLLCVRCISWSFWTLVTQRNSLPIHSENQILIVPSTYVLYTRCILWLCSLPEVSVLRQCNIFPTLGDASSGTRNKYSWLKLIRSKIPLIMIFFSQNLK